MKKLFSSVRGKPAAAAAAAASAGDDPAMATDAGSSSSSSTAPRGSPSVPSPIASALATGAATTGTPLRRSSKEENLDGVRKLRLKVGSGTDLNGRSLQQPLKVYCVLEYDQTELRVPSVNHDPVAPLWNNHWDFDASRSSEDVHVSIWAVDVPTRRETCLGTVHVTPQASMELNAPMKRVPIMPAADGDVVTGFLELACGFMSVTKSALQIEDFDLLKVIGKGSFGKVMLVRKRDTHRIYAMKIIRKANIIERDEVEHTIAERNVLAKIRHPFIVNLKFSFQTADKLYLVLSFVNGGELFKHLQEQGQFDEGRARFYAAELLLAIEHLHSQGIIYRDLKPENILLDYSGHLALCDFGLCKLNMTDGEKTNTFCGTPEYLAPELLFGKGYTKVVDWWTLGILLYEMLTGLPPFYSEDVNEMYRKILYDELTFPPEVSPAARDLLSKLLVRKPEKRLGYNGAEEIKSEPFFASVNWQKLASRAIKPPFHPDVRSVIDTSNFDTEFTEQKAVDSLPEGSELSASVQRKFEGFTFVADTNLKSYAATPQMGSSLMH